MKVKCIANTSTINPNETLISKFDLEVGTESLVYGIALTQDALSYLVTDKYLAPSWNSAELFIVKNNDLSTSWGYKFYGYQKIHMIAVWGYKELLNEEHYNGLAESEQKDISIFFQYKFLIDVEELGKDFNILLEQSDTLEFKDKLKETVNFISNNFKQDLTASDTNVFKEIMDFGNYLDSLSSSEIKEQIKYFQTELLKLIKKN